MLPLLLQRYEMARVKTVEVRFDYHVEVERHRFSVPQTWSGQELEARITTAMVSCCILVNVLPASPAAAVSALSPRRQRTCQPLTLQRWNGHRND